jgi:hypothetical protein
MSNPINNKITQEAKKQLKTKSENQRSSPKNEKQHMNKLKKKP